MKQITFTLTTMLGAILSVTPVAMADTREPNLPTANNTRTAFALPSNDAHREVSSLLKDIRVNAVQARYHANRLESMTRTPLRFHTWEAQARELTRIKEYVNLAGKNVSRLAALRNSALPWQQEALDKVETQLSTLAGNTTLAIERLNADSNNRFMPAYRAIVKNIVQGADGISDLVGAKLDYAKARAKYEQVASVR